MLGKDQIILREYQRQNNEEWSAFSACATKNSNSSSRNMQARENSPRSVIRAGFLELTCLRRADYTAILKHINDAELYVLPDVLSRSILRRLTLFVIQELVWTNPVF